MSALRSHCRLPLAVVVPYNHGRRHAAPCSSRRGCRCWPQCKLLLLDGQRQLQRRGALLECVLFLLRLLRIAVRAWSVTASGAS